jgi:hypothetical protein
VLRPQPSRKGYFIPMLDRARRRTSGLLAISQSEWYLTYELTFSHNEPPRAVSTQKGREIWLWSQ